MARQRKDVVYARCDIAFHMTALPLKSMLIRAVPAESRLQKLSFRTKPHGALFKSPIGSARIFPE
jgi:hypothetical protein